MAEPQSTPFLLEDPVVEKGTCRPGHVVTFITATASMVVRLENGDLEVVKIRMWQARYVVESVPLAGILTEFVTGWRRDRPMKGSGYRTPDPSDVEPVTAYAWIEGETGLSRADIKKAMKPDDHPHVDLGVADALVAAVGQPGMFHDGTLTVVERSCCGGSS